MRHKTTGRLIVLGLIATGAYATTTSADETLYNCCGNEKSALEERCRFTNRDSNCDYPADCKGDTYGDCCIEGCLKAI